MSKQVEEQVRKFYDNFGWQGKEGEKGEDALFRRFKPAYYPYHEAVNQRVLDCFSPGKEHLLIAGGGDLPETHVHIAKQFSAVSCIDISSKALDISREKLPEANMILGSVLNIPEPDNSIDAVYCAHVIYHIDKNDQEKAVREFIRVARPGGRIVIIYSNPRSLPSLLMRVGHRLKHLVTRTTQIEASKSQGYGLYYFTHTLAWWDQFNDSCKVSMLPWDVLANEQESALLPTNSVAAFFYKFCSWFELTFPKISVKLWQYPICILNKK